jgi:hypothetical protein
MESMKLRTKSPNLLDLLLEEEQATTKVVELIQLIFFTSDF